MASKRDALVLKRDALNFMDVRRRMEFAAIYVLGPASGEERLKIGVSTKPEEIIRHANIYSPVPVEIRGIFWTAGRLVAERVQVQVIRRLVERGYDRHANWHAIRFDEAAALVREAAAVERVPLMSEAEIAERVREVIARKEARLARIFDPNRREGS